MSTSNAPTLPARIARLSDLAHDLWWTWHRAREVFRKLDYPLWRETAHNPVMMLERIDPARLAAMATDEVFLAEYDRAVEALDALRTDSARTWWHETVSTDPSKVVAYFCAEFALHQSLPIYAGGLGVLAGDHCKEASDLGVPLVGVGFMYPQGYFRQRVSADGWQQENYEQIDWANAPVAQAQTVDGKPCVVLVPLGSRNVLVKVWQVRLGRVRLLLLDTDMEQNAPWDRELSARLYGGGQDTRLQQEIVLGLGGGPALRALGLTPAAWHLNEGHAAFVVLQRLRDFLAEGRTWEEALTEVRRTTIFTTHTPVPAGHDAFAFHMVDHHLSSSWGSMHGQSEKFLALGHHDSGNGAQFNMTALAMRSAGAINAVSELHGEVTRQMFSSIWQQSGEASQPIGAITNGVHVPTWVSGTMARLFEKHVSTRWRDDYEDPALWRRVLEIPDEEIWQARRTLRTYLFNFIRARARDRWTREQAGANRLMAGGAMLDPDILTIGFARRFTGYKRPDLVFREADRLAKLVTAAGRPVQFVFAGKAHPADEAGKHHMQSVFRNALDPKFGARIAFVDDYDLHVAHVLVQGCDVWLNTPRKPMEASGTSGMKAAMNGVLHLSIADGWWAEGYDGNNGWQIVGQGGADQDASDWADAQALYTLLEDQVVPTFYDRDGQDLPRRWIAMVKQSIATITPRFSARRMMKDYVRRAYAPAVQGAPSRASL